MKTPLLSIVMVALCVAPAYGQLHLLTGSPYSRGNLFFPAKVLKVDDAGAVQKIAEIVQPPMGTEWIGVSYEWRKAVVLATWEKAVFVVDLDKAFVVKSCNPPDPEGRSYMTSWLADVPGKGPAFVWEEAGAHPIKDAVWQGMVLDQTVPCEKSFIKLDASIIQYAVAHGHPGIADIVNADGVLMVVDEKGTGEIAGATPGKRIPFGYSIPREFLQGIERRGGYMAYLAANDSHVFVLSIVDPADRTHDFAFRKRDRTWHRLPRSGGYLRGFGRYIVVTEVLRSENAKNIPSAGMDKWKRGRKMFGPISKRDCRKWEGLRPRSQADCTCTISIWSGSSRSTPAKATARFS